MVTLGFFDTAGMPRDSPYINSPQNVPLEKFKFPIQFANRQNCTQQSRLSLQCAPGDKRCEEISKQIVAQEHTQCRLNATVHSPVATENFKDIYSCQDSTHLQYDSYNYSRPYFEHDNKLGALIPLL
jgi:hypothetical protein